MAFLSRVFGRKDKKQDEKALTSNSSETSASPLEGKFEYVIPSPSPHRKGPDYPHLSLNLPERRESRALNNVFGNEDLPGKTRLSPEQALVIIRACAQAITARGLETLGIMHPHWHSASPATQQRLILLFVQSSAVFESEVSSTRSPHDVAAVLRWAFRHLKLPGDSFGNDPAWYRVFFDAEKSASYPPKSFSEILAPQLPPVNWQLLNASVELFSSLAAHAEANGVSGSKLSKLLGLWLLTPERSTPDYDFISFYNQWDKQGRILEHIFLSYIRNEVAIHPMPKRLVELVKHYPYVNHSQPSPEQDLLPRPRFSTRRYDALFVHIDTEEPSSGAKLPKISLQLVADALNATNPSTSNSTSYSAWQKIQQTGNAVSSEELLYSATAKFPRLGRILSDDTLGILSLLADEGTQNESSINFVYGHTKFGNGTGKMNRSTSNHARELSASSISTAVAQPNSNSLGLDWNSFSTSGFLESTPLATPLAQTLLDNKDTEVTSPSVTPSRKTSRKSAKSPSRRSLDVLPPITIPALGIGPQVQNGASPTNVTLNSRVTKAELIKIDESFIDFWNDSLLDPITDIESWPRFVICRLKTSVIPEVESDGAVKKIEWMVIEQGYIKATPQLPSSIALSPSSQSHITSATGTSPNVESSPQSPIKRASSPRPSLSSSVNTSMKRFSFWSSSKKDKGDSSPTKKKKKEKDAKVGEMGELLIEEEAPKSASPPKKSVEVPAAVLEEHEDTEVEKDAGDVKGNNAIAAGVAAVATGVVATGVAAVIAEAAEKTQEEKVIPTVAEEEHAPSVVAPEQVEERIVDETTSPDIISQDASVSLSQPEPASVVEQSVPPAVEEPALVAEQPAPVVESASEAEPASAVEQPAPAIEEPALVVEQPAPPAVEEPASIAEQSTPAVEQPALEAEQPAPVVEEPLSVVEQSTPTDEQLASAVEQPALEESRDIPAEESVQIVEQPSFHSEAVSSRDPPPVVEGPSAAVEEQPNTPSEVTTEDALLQEPEPPVEETYIEPSTDKPTEVVEGPSSDVPVEVIASEATAVWNLPDEAVPAVETDTENVVSEPLEGSIVVAPEVEDEAVEPEAPVISEEVQESTTEEVQESTTDAAPLADVTDEVEDASSAPVVEEIFEPQVEATGVSELLVDENIVSTEEPTEASATDNQTVVVEEEQAAEESAEPSVNMEPLPIEEPAILDAPVSESSVIQAEAEQSDAAEHTSFEEPSASPEADTQIEEIDVSEPEIPVNEDDIPVEEPALEEEAPEVEESEPTIVEANETLEEIPVVDSEPLESIVHAEPLREPSPGPDNDAFSLPAVPIVDAPILAPPLDAEPLVEDSPAFDDDAASLPEVNNDIVNISDDLPPAPETVVLSGETPGPQLALSSSEVVTAALMASSDNPLEASAQDQDTVEEEYPVVEDEVADVAGTGGKENGSHISAAEHDEAKAGPELTNLAESEPIEA